MIHRRSRFQLYVDLLSAITRYPEYPLYRVAAIAGLNSSTTPELVQDLISHGLIKRANSKHHYAVTQRGFQWQKQFLILESMITGELITVEVNR